MDSGGDMCHWSRTTELRFERPIIPRLVRRRGARERRLSEGQAPLGESGSSRSRIAATDPYPVVLELHPRRARTPNTTLSTLWALQWSSLDRMSPSSTCTVGS
jgi:hypothetical protein